MAGHREKRAARGLEQLSKAAAKEATQTGAEKEHSSHKKHRRDRNKLREETPLPPTTSTTKERRTGENGSAIDASNSQSKKRTLAAAAIAYEASASEKRARSEGKGRWTSEEDEKLREAFDEVCNTYDLSERTRQALAMHSKTPPGERKPPRGFWTMVASHFPDRDYESVYDRAYRLLCPRDALQPWTADDEKYLVKLVHEHGTKWRIIGEKMARFPSACRDKYRDHIGEGMRTGPLTTDELAKLHDAVKKTQDGDHIPWVVIAKRFFDAKRNPSQLRSAWANHLGPSASQFEEPWTPEDERALILAVMNCGAKEAVRVPWGDLLPSRTDAMCRRKWTRMTRHFSNDLTLHALVTEMLDLIETKLKAIEKNVTVPKDFGRLRAWKKRLIGSPPKEPRSPYACFVQAQHAEVREQHPDMSAADVQRYLAVRWTRMTEEQRSVFVTRANEDQLRYEREVEEYRALHGKDPPRKRRGRPKKNAADSTAPKSQPKAPKARRGAAAAAAAVVAAAAVAAIQENQETTRAAPPASSRASRREMLPREVPPKEGGA